MPKTPKVAIIGAGIGGLATALRLAYRGCDVTVIDAHSAPGGKMRTRPTDAGPVDAGPTVVTMRPVFEDLFAQAGHALTDHVTLDPLPELARHYWDDGTCLDLFHDPDRNVENIDDVFGAKAAAQFRAFAARAKRLFDAFDQPMMHTSAPRQWDLTRRVLGQPSLIRDMAPHRTLAGLLGSAFDDPKLAQLFGRYATYVGGSPYQSPALLSLIWQAEAQGVWSVRGGVHKLAQAIETLAADMGATFCYDRPALRITHQAGRVSGVQTADGHVPADYVVFNGDPRALAMGRLGQSAKDAVRKPDVSSRSLSAYVHAFAAKPAGPGLAHHTVFFARDPQSEFTPLRRGDMPGDATLYLCAQDHGAVAPDALQRFEIIMNAPPVLRDPQKEKAQCQTQVFRRFQDFGLSFSPLPGPQTLTTPQGFDQLFPDSLGSLYGQSPHGLMAAFKRPTAVTPVPGLYLCGGGTHPGAGVPMATLSGKHAAEAIWSDHISTLTSHPTVTRGGMSTGSATVEPKRSLS